MDSAPTDGLIDISLSLSTMSSWLWRWPMSLSASRLRPRQQRGVADDDRDALEAVADVARRRKPLGDREAGAGVAAVHHVVLGLGAAREAADAVDLAERVEPLEAAGQQLVRVRLVAGVPDDPVAGRLEHPVERERDLDDAERGAEVAARRGDGPDDRLADLAREDWRALARSVRGGPRAPGGGRESARARLLVGACWPGWDGRVQRDGASLGVIC